MPGGKARGRYRADSPGRQCQMHCETVIGIQNIIADPPAFGLVERGQAAGHLGRIRPGDIGGKVQDMDAHIPQHPLGAMRGRQPPQPLVFRLPVAPGGLGQPALQIAGLEMPHRADCPFCHHMGSRLQGGDIAVAEVDHVHHARLCRRCRHRQGIGVGGRQRLFAQHMATRCQQRHRGGEMRGIGGDIGHGIEAAPVQRRVQRGKPVGDAMPVAERRQRLGAGIDPGGQHHAGDRSESLGMGLGHAAGAKDQQTDRIGHEGPFRVSGSRLRHRDAGADRVR